ncbi:MAG: GNAT family N-acetyltransferase, partial [Clostridia bacterium]
AGCTSFCAHADGYEMQIDTHPAHRGKGYGTCVGAAFVDAALEAGKVPYWDAANIVSARTAQRVGFRLTQAYPAWLLIPDGADVKGVEQRVCGK